MSADTLIPGHRFYRVLPAFADGVERLPMTVLYAAWPASWRTVIDHAQQRRFRSVRSALEHDGTWWLAAPDVQWITNWVAGVMNVPTHQLRLWLSECDA